jgi:hypothetical protein
LKKISNNYLSVEMECISGLELGHSDIIDLNTNLFICS